MARLQTAITLATIETNGVTDIAGNPLSTPAPSNFFIFAGDANRDRKVNALDFNALATHFGQKGALSGGGDFNCDGVVNTADFGALSFNFNKQLPPPPQQAAAPDLFSAARIYSRTDSELVESY